MGELRDLETQRRYAKVNPGWRAQVSQTRPSDPPGLTELLCPKCKSVIGAIKGDRYFKRCENCRRWVLLERY